MNDESLPTANYSALPRTIGFSAAKLISETCPLRGEEAADSMRLHLSKMSNQAAKDGLTESAVMNLLSTPD